MATKIKMFLLNVSYVRLGYSLGKVVNAKALNLCHIQTGSVQTGLRSLTFQLSNNMRKGLSIPNYNAVVN